MAKRDLLAPQFGLWLPFVLLLSVTGYLLLRALRGGRPLRVVFGRSSRRAVRAAT
jgi:hypothetical protein